jgi:hypothetical protein
MTLKTDLERTIANLTGLENAARTLKNQNFADIVLSARGRLSQLTEHPDIDTVQRHLSGEPEQGGGTHLKELLDRAHDSLKEAREAVDKVPKAESDTGAVNPKLFPPVNELRELPKAEPDNPIGQLFEPPSHPASGLPNGLLHRNAVGKLFEVRDGTWIPAKAEKQPFPNPDAGTSAQYHDPRSGQGTPQ